MKQLILLLIIIGLLFPSCATHVPQPVQSLSYQITKSSIRALDSHGKLVWEHPTQFLVVKVHSLANGNLVFAEVGKGAGGFLWCLSPTGKVLWKRQGRMWIIGIDKAGSVLVNGGSPRERYYARLYSASGEMLWSHAQERNGHQRVVGPDQLTRRPFFGEVQRQFNGPFGCDVGAGRSERTECVAVGTGWSAEDYVGGAGNGGRWCHSELAAGRVAGSDAVGVSGGRIAGGLQCDGRG